MVGFEIIWYIIIEFGSAMLILWLIKPPDYDKSRSNFRTEQNTFISINPEKELTNYNSRANTFATTLKEE